jgi:hypothetical protein
MEALMRKTLLVTFILFALFLGACRDEGSSTPEGGAAPAGSPSVTIDSVDAGVSVTATARNFPPDTAVDVFIGVPGHEGVDGEYVETTDSGSGTFTGMYRIPSQYADDPQLVIRLQTETSYYAWNTFLNQ